MLKHSVFLEVTHFCAFVHSWWPPLLTLTTPSSSIYPKQNYWCWCQKKKYAACLTDGTTTVKCRENCNRKAIVYLYLTFLISGFLFMFAFCFSGGAYWSQHLWLHPPMRPWGDQRKPQSEDDWLVHSLIRIIFYPPMTTVTFTWLWFTD